MSEDIITDAGATPEVTATEDSSYEKILAGQGAEPTNTVPDGDKTNLDSKAGKQTVNTPDPEESLIFEVDGKDVTIKRGDLERFSKITELERQLGDQKKNQDKDYTQKSQQVASARKSFEENFGRLPEPQELQALGKVWKAYFDNPKVQSVIDSIIAGNFEIPTGKPGDTTPQNAELRAEINNLKSQLQQFTGSIQEREQAKHMSDAKRTWESWVKKQDSSGIKITDEIDLAMSPFIQALRQRYPDWDDNQILDKAYAHATIDNLKDSARNEVLIGADKAKKGTLPRIKPKAPTKTDKEMSYAEIVQSAM